MLDNVEKLPGENIIVVTYSAPFNPPVDIGAAQQEIAELLKATTGSLVRIDNLSQAQMDWNSFVLGIQAATVDEPGSMVDPRIQGVLVGDYEMVKLASESMKQDQYGATNTPMFDSLDDALNFARGQN